MKTLLRVTEAAEELGLSRAKTYQLIAAGALRSLKIGRSRRVPSEAIRAFVESLQCDPDDVPPAA